VRWTAAKLQFAPRPACRTTDPEIIMAVSLRAESSRRNFSELIEAAEIAGDKLRMMRNGASAGKESRDHRRPERGGENDLRT